MEVENDPVGALAKFRVPEAKAKPPVAHEDDPLGQVSEKPVGDLPASAFAEDPLAPVATPEALNDLPPKLAHRLQYLAHLSSMGMTSRAMSSASGMSVAWINKHLKNPLVSELAGKLRNKFFGDMKEHRFKAMEEPALDTMEDLLKDGEKGSVRLGASKFILEQIHGRSASKEESPHQNTISDVYRRLDRMEEDVKQARKFTNATEVESTTVSPEKNSDSMESQENPPDSLPSLPWSREHDEIDDIAAAIKEEGEVG